MYNNRPGQMCTKQRQVSAGFINHIVIITLSPYEVSRVLPVTEGVELYTVMAPGRNNLLIGRLLNSPALLFPAHLALCLQPPVKTDPALPRSEDVKKTSRSQRGGCVVPGPVVTSQGAQYQRQSQVEPSWQKKKRLPHLRGAFASLPVVTPPVSSSLPPSPCLSHSLHSSPLCNQTAFEVGQGGGLEWDSQGL